MVATLVFGLLLVAGAFCQEKISFSCDGWTSIGTSCYKLFRTSQGFTWDQAQNTCKGLGSQLVDIDDFDQRKEVGDFAKAGGAKTFWTGLNRKDVDDSNTIKYMMGDKMASVYEGKWSVKQPDIDDGDCVYQMMQGDEYRNTLAKCKVKMAFVCQRNSCPTGSFHCFNGKCINQVYRCDDYNDCGDNSDETDCSSKCRYYMKNSGTIKSTNYPSPYTASKVCTWTLTGPEGSNIFINFTSFDIEKNQDVVDVFVGGSTESTSTHHAQLTGKVTTAQYRSWNNFMIVRFMTDADVQKSGFMATFSSVIDGMPVDTRLTATSTAKTLVPPVFNYDGNDGSSSRLGSSDTVWILKTEHRRKIITIKRVKIDLRAGDSLEIHDGDSPRASMLAKYTAANNDGKPQDPAEDKPSTGPEYVFSTDNEMYIILRTQTASVSGRAFELQYWEGCDVEYTTKMGQIFSPGYLYKVNYANYQTCTWSIKSPVAGRGITLHLDKDNGIEEMDNLQIFTEKNNDTGTKLHGNTNGFSKATINTALTSYSSNGEMFLRFKTNSILNERGFHGVYSLDCENPSFNAWTNIDGPKNWRYRDTINVTCKDGYTFSSEKFESYVVMTCQLGGTWSTQSIPRCQAVYCGMPDPVTNAYLAGLSGPGFTSIATYQCYPGFTLNGNANVSCQADAKWETSPTCKGAVCNALPAIVHGKQKITHGTSPNYATIIEYECAEGYELEGDPIVFCKSDSKWSNTVPTCKKLKCPVPVDDHGNYTGTLGSREFGQNIQFKCDDGYAFSDGAQIKVLLCHQNQTFEPFGGGCKNVDECSSVTLNECSHKCVDTEGGYTCECKEGFTLANDKKKCIDINECEKENGGCDQKCVSHDGGYTCSCDREGYVLFTADGTSGYKIQHREDGLKAGDVYRLNHTCVLRQCETAPPTVANGNLLTLQTVHRYGDIIEYMCDLGYEMSGSALFTCGSNGKWSPSTWPTCNVAVCPAASLNGVTNKPVLSPSSGTQKYLEYLNMTCSQSRPTPYTYKRQCLYDIKKNDYELFGAPYECKIIDCGNPKTHTGAKFSVTSTTYGSSFIYNCENLYSRSGKSTKGDITVRCLETGKWDFGNLQCVGTMCDDPGTPPGGSQVISGDGYGLNAEITFKCDRSDYSPNRISGISCVLNDTKNGLKWNDSIPSCVDTEDPQMLNCISAQTVKLFTIMNLNEPTFSDKTALKSVTVTPEYANSTLVLETDGATQAVEYKATDLAGNVKTCKITVTAQDTTPPTVTCPASKIEYVTDTDTGTRATVDVNTVTAGDNRKVTARNSNPTSVPANKDNLKRNEVTITVSDAAGLSDSCKYDVVVRANPCSPLSLVTPLNGKKTCSVKTGGYICEVTCNSGFVLYNGQRSQKLECLTNNAWNPEAVPACVSDSTPAYYVSRHIVEYTGVTDSAACHQAYKKFIEDNIDSFRSTMPGCTSSRITAIDVPKGLLSYGPESGTKFEVNFTLEYKPDNLLIDHYKSCNDALDIYFKNIRFNQTSLSHLSPGGCATSLGNGNPAYQSGFLCTNGQKTTVDGKQKCLSCPAGTYSSGNGACTLCPKGQYQPEYGKSSCLSCTGGKNTLYVGSTSNAACVVDQCPQGFYSNDGYPPCSQCPKNSYWTNSTYCSTCPTGQITLSTGSTSNSLCRAKCPKGQFSYNGYAPNCAPCPRNYYQVAEGQTTCSACGAAFYTKNEGSTLITDCIQALPDLCTANKPCVNGTCSILNHDYKCTCNAGYYGRNCDKEVEHCKSSPCYNGGQCIPEPNGYRCNCPTGSSGSRCEEDINTECIPNNPCKNGGKCQNLFGKFHCVCASGFTGADCSSQEDVCKKAPLCSSSNGKCIAHDNIRRTCQCNPGFTGELCEDNINDCASNPCLYGAKCIDQENGYHCQCTQAFYKGENCENRESQCLDNTKCDHGGKCIDDYTKDTYRCICPPHHTYGEICQFEVHVTTKIQLTPTSQQNLPTLGDCLGLCKGGCEAASYDSNTKTCRRYNSLTGAVLSQDVNTLYMVRKCSKVQDAFWTPWFDIDDPGSVAGGADSELKSVLENDYNITICNNSAPIRAECRVKGTGKMWTETNDNFVTPCGINGLRCENLVGNTCEDYEVRYECASHRVFDGVKCSVKDYCTPNPCHNGGLCVKDTGEARFKCACQPGWTGSLCQHSEDNCKDNPCNNNGTCVDKHNTYECKCPSGFSGVVCQNNINNCNPNQCSNAGSSDCKDGIDDFTCVCNPGYTGKKCETNINECYSDPCLHGGKCVDQENDFKCTCVSGWEGKRCEIVSNQCSKSKPCPASAPCSNLFDDFYCDCPTGSYGKKCENFPDLCGDSNPCLNKAPCSVNVTTVSCKCSPDFKGFGCQTIVNHCGNPNQCKNGGTCITKSPTGFECKCPKGFSGSNCEVNVNDCAGVTCLGGATCIDMVNQYFCRCPLKKTGENCAKSLSLDYDMSFYLPSRTGYAALQYPIKLSGDAFSLSVWIKFYEKDQKGTVLSIFTSESANSLAVVKPFLDITDAGVTVYEDSQTKELSHQFLKLNDGQWNYVVVIWDKTNGMDLLLGGISQQKRADIFKGKVFNENIWVTIGSKFNTSTMMPIADQGFRGHISQLNIYNRNLNFKTESNTIIDYPNATFPNLILAWNEFKLYKGVNYVYPSTAERCKANCVATATARQGPYTNNCPKDIYVFDQERPPKVDWEEPVFQGVAQGKVKSNMRSGNTLAWGKYQVTYEARDDKNNAAFCHFNVYVQYDNCSDPAVPYSGKEVCENGHNPYHGCVPSCNSNDQVIDRYTPKIFTCGPLGSWHPEDVYRPLRYPSCGKISSPARKNLMCKLTYPQVTLNNCIDTKTTLLVLMREAMAKINTLYSENVCSNVNCTDVQVKIDCGSASAVTVVTVTIDVPSALATWTEKATGKKFRAADVLTRYILEDSLFDVTQRIPNGALDPNGFVLEATDVCNDNETVINGNCVKCGPGNFFNTTTKICDDCPVGEYQDMYGQTSCKPCTKGLTTETVGASSSSYCKASCTVGNYFSMKDSKCVPCMTGFYQDMPGKFYCFPCPPGNTTRGPGSNSSDACKDDCRSGTELAPNGSCTPCPLGTYRTQGKHALCIACDPALTTLSTGSTSDSACNIKACTPGQKRVGTDKCENCPVGTYQDKKWQTDCISCGGARYRTDTEASTRKDQCKFFCQDGYENINKSCVACKIGTYRNNSVDGYYVPCQPCGADKLTLQTASTSKLQCVLHKCSAGEQPNSKNDGCIKCPVGTYQPTANQQSCLNCSSDKSTRKEGSTSSGDCETYCKEGEEKLSTGKCDPCGIGYYKHNKADVFMKCTACRDNYVTPTTGSVNDSVCTIRNCTAGTKRKADDSGCEDCPLGYYQHMPYKLSCIKCPYANQSTQSTKSTSLSDCQTYCKSGEEKIASGCQPCPRGYFKDNTKQGLFAKCEMCKVEFITPSTGTVSSADCKVGNCTAGQKRISATERCEDCPIGFYQPEKWQDDCKKCPTHKTTVGKGTVSSSDCKLQCDAGLEDINGTCVNCSKGYYKETNTALKCSRCTNGTTTEGVGATSKSQCSLPSCAAGTYLDNSGTPACKPCPYDQYQDKTEQEKCEQCPLSRSVTLETRANSKSKCVLNCTSGQEYQAATDKCVVCERGYFRNNEIRSQTGCQMCPIDKITASSGAKDASECNIKNCTKPGQFRDPKSNTCKDCEAGTYSDKKWLDECKSCGTGYTTQFTGRTSSNDCQRDCESGTYAQNNNDCVKCPKGKYRTKGETWTCQNCPEGTTTPSDSSTSKAACSLSICSAGQELRKGKCEACPVGKYQPESAKMNCISCPDNGITSGTGSTSSSDCQSYCSSGKNNCSSNAVCKTSAQNTYTCTCKANYSGDGFNCTHQCDLGYCKSGKCSKDPLKCECFEFYTGEQCDVRIDSSKQTQEKMNIIIGTIVGATVLLLIILVVVAIIVAAARKSPPPKYIDQESFNGNASQMNDKQSLYRSEQPSRAPSVRDSGNFSTLAGQSYFDNRGNNMLWRESKDIAVYEA